MKAIATVIAALALSGCASISGAACDRACLEGELHGYLTAIATRDLPKADFAANFRATENGVEVANGEGIAKTLTGLGDVQRHYFDPATGQAAYLGLAQEGDVQILVGIRIRVEGGKIAESETFIARRGEPLFNPDGFRADPPRANSPLPAADRTSRAEMIAAANSYFEGLEKHNSALVAKVPGCNRLENGTKVTNRPPRVAPATAPGVSAAEAAVEFAATDCGSGLERMTPIAGVAFRRFPLVDEEQGVVMGIGMFRRPPGQTGNFARRLLLTEFFDVKAAKVAGIYAVMHYLDPAAPDGTGWN